MRKYLLAVLLGMLSACAQPFSNETLDLVEPNVPFVALRHDPDQFKGRLVLLGGAIVGVRNTTQGGELEIVQLATDDEGRIRDNPTSGGRFLARSGDFIDPAVYRQGLLVSLVGETEGKVVRPLSGVDYLYPVLAIREIHLWQPEQRMGPRFHFGFGVGTVFH